MKFLLFNLAKEIIASQVVPKWAGNAEKSNLIWRQSGKDGSSVRSPPRPKSGWKVDQLSIFSKVASEPGLASIINRLCGMSAIFNLWKLIFHLSGDFEYNTAGHPKGGLWRHFLQGLSGILIWTHHCFYFRCQSCTNSIITSMSHWSARWEP